MPAAVLLSSSVASAAADSSQPFLPLEEMVRAKLQLQEFYWANWTTPITIGNTLKAGKHRSLKGRLFNYCANINSFDYSTKFIDFNFKNI